MRLFLQKLGWMSLTIALTSCVAATEKPSARPVVVAPVGTSFDGTGKVSLHTGQPCTSQIMFDFRGANMRAPVYLAAHVKDSNLLTDAARHHRTVRISGTWQHGREKTCRYLSVTSVTVLKSFLSW